MEIGGPLQALPTTICADQCSQQQGQSPNSSAQNHTPAPPPPRQIIRTDNIDIEAAYNNRKRRFQSMDVELPYQARQAIGTYEEADYAAGPELLHRVDVYA